MTSPSTGCGAGVICVPGKATTTVDAEKPTTELVCSGTYTGVRETGTVHVSYTYLQITHQFGLWGGAEPDIITESGVPLWNTTPPYVTGEVNLIFEYAHLYDQNGIYEKIGTIREATADAGVPIAWFAEWERC
jgi:hypothetical protein